MDASKTKRNSNPSVMLLAIFQSDSKFRHGHIYQYAGMAHSVKKLYSMVY